MRLDFAVAFATILAIGECSRLTPPVLPLIVRNPYLSTWLTDARGLPWESWPMFWTGQQMGLGVLASLPDNRTVFPLLGRPHDALQHNDPDYKLSYPIYLGSKYDASTTNLTYSIPVAASSDLLNITLSFLSPITPTSTVRQAIPAAYISVYVSGTVDIYIDINGQWVSGDRGSKIRWEFNQTSLDNGKQMLQTWRVKSENEQLFTEYLDRAEWGTLHFSGPTDVRYESGTSAVLRQRFSRTGTLQNQIDSGFRGIMDEEPVFAFSKSFYNTNKTSLVQHQSVTFSIAHTQDTVVQFASARGLTLMRPLWASYFPNVEEMLIFHYLDFENTSALASNYSAQLAIDAHKSGAEDYVDIVALTARQVLGATTFSGTPDNPLLFYKEINSGGNAQTIDMIYPFSPFFLYTNPRWLAYLLEPLMEHMLSGQYPNKYAMHDLGTHFPNATGHPLGLDEYMPVEECGNILILGLALANSLKYGLDTPVESTWKPTSKVHLSRQSQDSVFPLTIGDQDGISFLDEIWKGGPHSEKQAERWLTRSYRLWKQWTGYLVDFSLRPYNQLSTDDFAGPLALHSNLALKGIIGIKAMAGIADFVDNKADAKMYNNISEVYIEKWEEYAISRDKTHAKLAYDWYGSWTMTYNLYADSLLCFHLGSKDTRSSDHVANEHQQLLGSIKGDKDGFVPKHIYQMQSDWYYSVRQKYGVPLDSRHLYTKTDWEFFSMAVVAPKVRAEILQSVAKWVNETATNRPLTDLHDTEGNGDYSGAYFISRPAVGGHFAFLSLKQACGGKAMDGLEFLDNSITEKLDVASILLAEKEEFGLLDVQEL